MKRLLNQNFCETKLKDFGVKKVIESETRAGDNPKGAGIWRHHGVFFVGQLAL